MFVSPRGSAMSRAGTAFVGQCKQPASASSTPPVDIPFLYDIYESYALEFGGKRILDFQFFALKPSTDAFFFYHYDELQAVRVGTWKYIRKTNLYIWPIPLDAEAIPSKFGANQLGSDRLPLLYDLSLDPGEKYNVLAAYPDVAAKLENLISTWEAQNKKNPRGFVALAA
jgi:hypothetical protein